MIAQQLQYLTTGDSNRLLDLTDAVGRNLNALINSVSEKPGREPASKVLPRAIG